MMAWGLPAPGKNCAMHQIGIGRYGGTMSVNWMLRAWMLQADEPADGGEYWAEKSIRIVSPIWLARFAIPFGIVAPLRNRVEVSPGG
jgi:hypothetical protein